MAHPTQTRMTISETKLKTLVRKIAREVVRDELAKVRKTPRARARPQQAKRDARLRRHFGAIDLGYATDADNGAIDSDLARAYGTSHTQVP